MVMKVARVAKVAKARVARERAVGVTKRRRTTCLLAK